MTRVSVLTPPGTAAVATVKVHGSNAWSAARQLFRPLNSTLPESLPLHHFWYGRVGEDGDEVILAVRQIEPEPVIEIHCHGGRRVVQWIVERFTSLGCVETNPPDNDPWALLERACTVRTASILLDQCLGAFDQAVSDILKAIKINDADAAQRQLEALAAVGPVGRHLVTPWTVVIAGAPNVGKSSLVNALAGYQRSVVSDVAGTTRDVVITSVAFDGWLIELADTAGLRRAAESLEAAGVELARRFTKNADVLVWVIDATNPIWPNPADRTPDLLVVNKSDIAPASISASHSNLLYVSARTGVGLGELVEVITRKIVPTSPTPGTAVPYTADLANTIDAALVALHAGNLADTHSLLKSCLTLTA